MRSSEYRYRLNHLRVRRRTFVRGGSGIGVALVTAALLGCRQERAPAPVAPPVAEQPKYGGTLAFQTFAETPHQDPHQTNLVFFHDSGMGVAYSRLFHWKLGPEGYPDRYVVEGDLVEKWEQPDSQSYIFHLYRGVKWHNIPPVSGRELVSRDVVFSLRRQMDLRVNGIYLEGAEQMTALDNYTVRVDLARPNADFLLGLGHSRNAIVAPEAVEQRGDLKEGPTIGTGAWIFKEWQPNQVVRMVKNPEYFHRGRPYADGLDIFRIADPQTQQAAFRTKQIHVLGANRQVQELLKRDVPALQVQQAQLVGGNNKLWLNFKKPPLNDIRVRQALSKALDRQAIIQSVHFGSGWVNVGVVMPSLDWYLPESEYNKLLAQDLQGARQLLAAAGVTNLSLSLQGGPSQNAPSIQVAELVVAQLRNINVSANLVPVTTDQMVGPTWGRGEFEALAGGQQPENITSFELRQFYKTDSRQNGAGLGDRELDEMIEKQATLVEDTEARRRLLQDIQRKVLDQALIIRIVQSVNDAVVQPFVKGYVHAPAGEYSRWEYAWLDL